MGVLGRTIIIVELSNLLAHFFSADSGGALLERLTSRHVMLELNLLATLAILALLSPWIQRANYFFAALASIALSTMTSIGSAILLSWLAATPQPDIWAVIRIIVFTTCLTTISLSYFHWRQLAETPSIQQAQFIALSERMKPHFIFNSLNCAIALIPDDPEKAEQTLENLSDLIREFMREPNQMSTLNDEKRLCACYLSIEKIRLGNRLAIQWDWDDRINNVTSPSLVLQPLVENAVRHGISTIPTGGNICIEGKRDKNFAFVTVTSPKGLPNPGNVIATRNIRERLFIAYEGMASLETYEIGAHFVSRLKIPL